MHVLDDIPIACTQVEPPVIVGIRWTATVLIAFLNTTRSILKQCFLRKTMSPQPSSFVGYIENYGIKFINS